MFLGTTSAVHRLHDGVGARAKPSTLRFVSPELGGTESARADRSVDGGESWKELESVARIPGHEQWYAPDSPRAGGR